MAPAKKTQVGICGVGVGVPAIRGDFGAGGKPADGNGVAGSFGHPMHWRRAELAWAGLLASVRR